MTKKKQKKQLNTCIGGSKKRTKRNVLGIRKIYGGEDEFTAIWTAYEGLNDIINGMELKKMGKAIISAARRFVVSTLIVVLRSKNTIIGFMEKNEIHVPPDIKEWKDVKFTTEDRNFILLFKSDKTSRHDMKKAYDACLTQDGVVKKLKSEFDKIIQKLSEKTQTISSEKGQGAGKAFNKEIETVKGEVSYIDTEGNDLLNEVETDINEDEGTTTEAANTIEDEVSVADETSEEAEAEDEAPKKSFMSRMFGRKTPQEEDPQEEETIEEETIEEAPQKRSMFSLFNKTTTEETPQKRSMFSFFNKKTPEATTDTTTDTTTTTEGGSRKKRHSRKKRKHRKSSKRKK